LPGAKREGKMIQTVWGGEENDRENLGTKAGIYARDIGKKLSGVYMKVTGEEGHRATR
jgi:hypothetical protein